MTTTIDKSNICVVISSYPQNYLDHSLLGLTIESWKQQGYDICLVSHSPLNPDVQKASKYYIYSDENEILEYPEYSPMTWYHWDDNFLYQTNWGNTLGNHSYAILKNMQNAFQLLRPKRYTHFIYVEVDGFLTNENHDTLNKRLEEADFMNQNYWLPVEMIEDKYLPITNFFGGRLDYFNEQLKQILTPEKYMEIAIKCGGYSLESFFAEMFIKNPIGKGYFERVNSRNIEPIDWLDNEWFGSSRGGEVNVPKLKHRDWWLDIVKDKNSNNLYAIVSGTGHKFNTKLVFYKDNQQLNEMDLKTGPFYWFKLGSEGKKWKLEQKFNNEVIKKVEYTKEQVLNNIHSHIEFK
jgi:hypothetical protein